VVISFNIFINFTKYLQRYEIVNAVVEAEGVTDHAAKEGEDKADEGTFLKLNQHWRNYFWMAKLFKEDVPILVYMDSSVV
jgi:hypothetical protein